MPRPASSASLLARLEWVLLLAALLLVVLAYPQRLHDPLILKLGLGDPESPAASSGWFYDQFQAFFLFFYSPLILKAVLAGYCLLGFAGVRLARWLLEPEALRDAAAHGLAPAHVGGPRLWLSVAIFFGWAGLSCLWSVTPELGRIGSVYALIYGLAFWLLIRRGFTWREMRTVAWVLVGLGAAALLYLVAQRSPHLLGRWVTNPFGADEYRNRMGTLLGHNAAASAFLLMSWFVGLALLLTTRQPVRRGLLVLYLGAVICAIIVMQSRTAWVLAPLLGFLALRRALARVGLRFWGRLPLFIALVIAAVILAQLIDRPWNPLFVRENPFIQRLQAISPAGLKSEARLRLNIIGLRLVSHAPWLGSGMYSFQFAYPAEQNRYFAEHPDSDLNRPVVRSHMAHNEYLQIWIEQGTIGLALCCWMLWCLARAGARARRAPGLDRDQLLLHEAFGWSALFFLLHGLVDFPFHLPQLALPGLFCLVAWAAPHASPKFAAAATQAPSEGLIYSTGLRPLMVLRLLGATLAIGGIPFAGLPLARYLHADVLLNHGNAYLSPIFQSRGQIDPVQKFKHINRALGLLEQSRRFAPGIGMTSYAIAQAYALLGATHAQAVASSQVPADMKPDAAKEAVRTNERALRELDLAAKNLDFYLMYFLRASIYGELQRVAEALPGSTPRPAADYRTERRRQLEKTVYYSTTFGPGLYQLAEQLAREPHPDQKRILQLRKALYRWAHDTYFTSEYINRAFVLMNDRLYPQADQAWRQILEIGPLKAEWMLGVIHTKLMLGDPATARRLLADLRERDPAGFAAMNCDILLAALRADWLGVLEALESARGYRADLTARWRALEEIVEEQLDRRGFASMFNRPEEMPEAQWNETRLAARAEWLAYFQAWPAAADAVRTWLTTAGKPDANTLGLGIVVARRQGDAALERDCAAQLAKIAPRHPLLSATFQ